MSYFWFRSEPHTDDHDPSLDRILVIPSPVVKSDWVDVHVDVDVDVDKQTKIKKNDVVVLAVLTLTTNIQQIMIMVQEYFYY